MSRARPPRRVKPSPVARIRPFWVLITLGAVLALGLAATLAFWPGFDPRVITVSGNHRVSTSEILARARIARWHSIWLTNARSAARRIEAIPYIDRAWVHRFPPSTIRIAVTERVPFAVVLTDTDAAIVDRSLRVLEPASYESTLPVFAFAHGALPAAGSFVRVSSVTSLRDAYDQMTAHGLIPVRLEIDAYGELVATLPSGLRLLFGEAGDLASRVTLANAVLAQVVRGQRKVAAIDLRAPATPVVTYR